MKSFLSWVVLGGKSGYSLYLVSKNYLEGKNISHLPVKYDGNPLDIRGTIALDR